jgi:hypothetical protein
MPAVHLTVPLKSMPTLPATGTRRIDGAARGRPQAATAFARATGGSRSSNCRQ